MSYCRFSSDDFRSDVYCYESATGFIIHVASNRYTPFPEMPEPVPLTHENVQQYLERHKRVRAILDGSPRESIGLSHDGDTLEYDTPGEAADALQRLKDEGYWVPDGTIDALREEEADRLLTEPES